MSERKEVKVVYSVRKWLPLTMRWIYNQIKYLESFKPLILADSTTNLQELPDIPVVAINGKHRLALFELAHKLGFRFSPSNYDSAIKKHHPTLLHSHVGNRAWYDLPLAKKHNLKQIVTFYGADLSYWPAQYPVWKKRYEELFNRADLFLCEGPYMATSLNDLGCSKDKIVVHRLGVDLNEIAYCPRKPPEDGKLRILIAGRFTEKKGIPYAIKAIGLLGQKNEKTEITIIGDAGDTRREKEEKSKIMQVIKKYKLQNKTRMLGFQPYEVLMEEAYRHHIFVSPSINADDGDAEGGLPITIIEMAASGMPVVSTNHCDIPGLIIHQKTGLLAEERNVDELAGHLEWLCSHPGRWSSLIANARKRVEKNFNVLIQGQRLLDIYASVGI
jgi:colanic acid/amylovoran biosynthesis glycosyltransferase